MLCIVLTILIIVSGSVYAYQRYTGKRSHRATDFVTRAQHPHVSPDLLVCCKCSYNLRGLPEVEPGHIGCPECGERFELAHYCRPCWIGPRSAVPLIWSAYFSSVGVIFFAVVFLTSMAIAAGAAGTGGEIPSLVIGTVISLFGLVGGCLLTALVLSNRVGSFAEALKLAVISLAADVCSGVMLVFLIGGFVAIISGLVVASESAVFEPLPAVYGVAGGLALFVLTFVFGKITRLLMDRYAQSLVDVYVRRVDAGLEPFPGLSLYWVLSNKSEDEFDAIRRSLVLFGMTLYRPKPRG